MCIDVFQCRVRIPPTPRCDPGSGARRPGPRSGTPGQLVTCNLPATCLHLAAHDKRHLARLQSATLGTADASSDEIPAVMRNMPTSVARVIRGDHCRSGCVEIRRGDSDTSRRGRRGVRRSPGVRWEALGFVSVCKACCDATFKRTDQSILCSIKFFDWGHPAPEAGRAPVPQLIAPASELSSAWVTVRIVK
jgi:hypothetical protein